MLLSQLQSSRPWIPPPRRRLLGLRRGPPPPSEVMQIRCLWSEHAAFCWHGTTRHKEGKLDARSQRTGDAVDFRVCSGNRNNFDAKFFAMDQNRDYQDPPIRSVMSTVSLYAFLRLSQLNSACTLTKIFQKLLPHLFPKFLASGAPFACISNSLNKPMPLNLDVSLPSLGDIRWNFARMIYLFNIQLERNIATFFVVLLLACFSFVVIGGFLFFKFRGSKEPLEDCFWEAWACLCSSSTHLRETEDSSNV